VTSLLVLLSVSPSLARQFTIVTNASVVLSLAVYLASALALLRLAGALPQRLRIGARIAAVLCSAFCIALIAASETASLVGSAAVIAISLAVYFAARLRRMRVATLG
jgi:amino acid transporter